MAALRACVRRVEGEAAAVEAEVKRLDAEARRVADERLRLSPVTEAIVKVG